MRVADRTLVAHLQLEMVLTVCVEHNQGLLFRLQQGTSTRSPPKVHGNHACRVCISSLIAGRGRVVRVHPPERRAPLEAVL
jgi:hypothetical protein